MRFLFFLDRKKQIAPSSRSSVHPACHGQDVFCVKGAKIKEILGPETPQECQEVDELLNITSYQVNPSSCTDDDDDDDEDDDDEDDDGSTEEDEEKCNDIIGMPQPKGRSKSDLQFSPAHVDPAAQKLALPPKSSSAKLSEEHATRKPPCSIDVIMKENPLQVSVKVLPSLQPSEDCATQKPCAVDMNAKAGSVQESVRKGRPAKLTCVSDKSVPLSRNCFGTTSERTTAPHPNRNMRKKNASCVVSFPLPPPLYEKHLLPIPQARASEYSVAHPLPQPPPIMRTSNGCVLEHFDDKAHPQIARAVSCDPLIKPQLSVNKEYEHTVSSGPPRQSTQKQKASQSVLGGFPVPTQKLQKSPPTTPCPQAPRTPQNTLLTIPGMQTPQSTPPATPHTQLHQTPQNTPPATPRTHQTPQNTPPITPRSQPHPHVFINVSRNAQSPPSSNKQSPRLTTHSHSPPHFPFQLTQLGYSPPCSPLPRSICPRKWSKGEILGQGTFGTVYAGLNLEDGSFFAVKVSCREDTSPEIQQEVDVLSQLEHPNIVRYFGSSIVDRRLCIFLELVSMGSLDSLLKKYKRFEDHTIRSYTRQILLGLEYLHKKKTIHRDIKCGNILADVHGQVKLSDFGIAKQVDESLASSLKGTPLYMAPEVLMPIKSSKSCYSFPADIWSLGCTVFELADGKPPWSNLQGFAFFFKVKSKELPPMPEHLSPEGRDFIRSCLQFHPKDRLTASQLLQHPFVLNVATPEPPFPLSSPSSPLSPKLWPQFSQSSSSTWACGHCYPSSPGQVSSFDQVFGGSQKAQTLIHGR